MYDLAPLHAFGFALYLAILLAGPVMWWRRGEASLRALRELSADDAA